MLVREFQQIECPIKIITYRFLKNLYWLNNNICVCILGFARHRMIEMTFCANHFARDQQVPYLILLNAKSIPWLNHSFYQCFSGMGSPRNSTFGTQIRPNGLNLYYERGFKISSETWPTGKSIYWVWSSHVNPLGNHWLGDENSLCLHLNRAYSLSHSSSSC